MSLLLHRWLPLRPYAGEGARMTRRQLPALMSYERGTLWRGYVNANSLPLLDWSTRGDAGRYW